VFEWNETLISGVTQESKKMMSDENGNIFLVGDYTETKNKIVSKVFVAKYNSDKKLIWVKLIGNDNNSKIQSITLDGKGSPIVTGFFTGTLSLDNRGIYVLTSHNEKTSGFVIKLNALGDTEWAQSFLTSDVNYHVDLMVNENQDITVFGLSNTRGAAGKMNMFFYQVNSTGETLSYKYMEDGLVVNEMKLNSEFKNISLVTKELPE